MREALSLPAGAACYRQIGPFDAESLPAGLRAEHRLKPGVWALLSVTAGELKFVWDDGRPDPALGLCAGDTVVVPPEVPHHVEAAGDFIIGIAFHR